MTQRLYYQDCYLRDFRAKIVDVADEGRRVYLDRTAFYPTSGGQPFDTGTLGGVKVIEVLDEEATGDSGEKRIAHVLERPSPVELSAGDLEANEIEATIDWPRRFDHMQQHTGQHLLSAVLEQLFKIPTVSFHMGANVSTIEITAESFDAKKIEQAEERCAEIIAEARPVNISFEEAASTDGLRKPSQRLGTLRIIEIRNADRSACGGTHVKTTAEIGALFIRKLEKIRGNTRLEFVCGLRALRHARGDFHTLQEISRLLSVPASDTSALVAAQIDRVKTLEKASQRLVTELAQHKGREQWVSTTPGSNGMRTVVEHGAIDDGVRTRAQAFTKQGQALFVMVSEDPASILLAASLDSGIHAGDRLKAAAAAAGGRGGGNAAVGQGSFPAGVDLAAIVHALIA
jgi:alanyl-tRNA synthetase